MLKIERGFIKQNWKNRSEILDKHDKNMTNCTY